MIHIICGDGKGKTSSAIGLAIRAAGRGKRVLIARFLKDNDSGELITIEKIDKIEVCPIEKSFGFTWQMDEATKQEAKEYYNHYLQDVIKKINTGNYQMLVLDELMSAYNYDFVDHEYVLEFLKHVTGDVEIVMTGRNPKEELLQVADYVSEIKKIKHPYDLGICAREGIEY